mmetsp:Transcript_70265/g.206087  ORF Transcript_70265/g.206087 Transcript_70265/m.206087 type:complete len:429 (-) Transcript_70265:66-1352(-)
MSQQSGIGLGIVGDGKGWSGGATRSDGGASQPSQIKEKRPTVFLEIELHSRKLGSISLELFGDVVPRTVENFRCLCTGEKGVSPVNGKALHFKGSRFHKILPGSIIQGGDLVHGTGKGGASIYNFDGDGTFSAESFKMKHDRPGLLSMAFHNNEDGKFSSQFFFTSKALPKLDGKNVVFGRVIKGMDLVMKLESVGSQSGKPLFECIISDCGEEETDSSRARKRKVEALDPLPPGWTQKESRSKPGLFYYVHEDGGFTQFERPTTRGRDPLASGAAQDLAKRRREEAEKKPTDALPVRAVSAGEARVWHILKKHKDFFGKAATSWRQKKITWTKQEAKQALLKLKDKLFNVGYGGGQEALQRKFENYARLESDDDLSAKMGGDLGPVTKKRKLFGGYEIAKAAFETKIGEISDVIETNEGMHLLARFE